MSQPIVRRDRDAHVTPPIGANGSLLSNSDAEAISSQINPLAHLHEKRDAHASHQCHRQIVEHPKEDFANAVIKFDEIVRGAQDELVNVFAFQTSGDSIFFEADFEFEQNGYDFRVKISNFGLFRKTLAGSISAETRGRFTAEQIECAKNRISEYFLGPEEKLYSPFSFGDAKALGVDFPPGWAIEEKY